MSTAHYHQLSPHMRLCKPQQRPSALFSNVTRLCSSRCHDLRGVQQDAQCMSNHAGSATQPTTTSCQRTIDQLEQQLFEPSSSTSWAPSSTDAAPGTNLHVAANNSSGSFASTSGIPAASGHQTDSNTPQSSPQGHHQMPSC